MINLLWAQAQLDRMALNRAYAAEIHQPLDNTELQQLIRATAQNNGIDEGLFLSVANCESGLVTDIQSHFVRDGVQERSFGLFQINLDAHPDVSYAQATDPYYNVAWAARHFNDQPTHWKTCMAHALATAGEVE